VDFEKQYSAMYGSAGDEQSLSRVGSSKMDLRPISSNKNAASRGSIEPTDEE